MEPAKTDSQLVAELSDEAADSVRIDIPEGSSDSLARYWCPGSGSRTVHDIQSRKGKASGNDRRIEYLAKIEENGSVGSSQYHSHVRDPR